MNNIFSGLSVGLRALETQRKSLDVTGHNIANANNEDYNKQRAVHKASYPYTAPGLSNHGGAGQFGTGVEIEQVERVKDQFINSQIFNETQSSGRWQETQRGLEKIEYILNEPSDTGIDSAMNEFWSSLQDLSNNPSDDAARNMVRENARNVIDSFQSVENQLNDYKESINDNLSNAAADINSITKKMADLNKQIVSVKGSGQNPNDLMDQRDALYKDLNELINVQSREDAQGNLIVSTQGMQLVNGSDAYELEVEPGDPGKFNDTLVHSRTETELEPTNGKIAAWMDMRDNKLNVENPDSVVAELNDLAQNMVENFNTQHRAGYDAAGVQGENFFKKIDENSVQSTIFQLDLTAEIKDLTNGLSKIAAGNGSSDSSVAVVETLNTDKSDNFKLKVDANGGGFNLTFTTEAGEQGPISVDEEDPTGFKIDNNGQITETTTDPDFEITAKQAGDINISLGASIGNGENANALSNIFNQQGDNIESEFRKIVTSVGAESSRAQQMNNNQDAVLKQLNTLDESVSGVSLDEEMANLIKYQQSYAAAAKYITKTDELLQTLMTIV